MKSILFLLVLALASAQDTATKPLIAGNFTSFTTDELGNIYVLDKDELALYRSSGAFWMRNSIKTIGTIHTMDLFYSLKPVLYSQELQQLAVLDNTLSVQGDLLWLNRKGFPQVNLVAASVQNHFWLYDQLDMQLVRVDRQWNKVSESGRIDQLLGFTPEPKQIIEYDNWLYLNDPDNGILVFDLFGTYAKTIPIKQAEQLQIRKNKIYFIQDGKGYGYNMRDFSISELAIPVKEFSGMRVEADRVLYLTETGLYDFKL